MLDALLAALGSLDRAAAAGRDVDEVAAPVVGVAAALDVPGGLQLVQQQHDVVGVEAQRLGDRLLGDAVVLVEERQRDELPQTSRSAASCSSRSIYMFVAVGGASAGLLAGGLLTDAIGWHWIFFINLPIGLITLLLGRAYIVESEAIGLGGGVDVLGATLVTVALMLGVYAIVGSADHGWGSAYTLGWGGTALAMLVAFVVRQARIANPIMPLGIFRVPGLAGSAVVRGLVISGMSRSSSSARSTWSRSAA